MISKKLFGLKKGMRAIALGLAAVLTVGSLNVMDVEAAGVTGLTYPKYDATESSPTSGTYIYNSGDIFGAATHVHLFGEEVKTTGVHTHGNIMANEAWIGNSGMNEGKISYPLDYREVSYVANAIHQIDSNITGDLVIGPNITYTLVEQSANITKISFDGKLVEVKRGNIYKDTDTVKAVDIATELANLATLSANWAAQGGTTINNLDSHTIETNQNENPTSNIYINIPYSVWDANGDTLKITELDSNVNNRGIVVINIDAQGNDSIYLTCIGAGIMAVDSAGNVYSNSEHTTAAFGSCRIVYNIVDNGQPYEGTVEFMNTVFGSILAPKATVKVGAVNGTVMAKNITHTGQESHRMDIWPIFTDSTSVIEYDEIRLMLTYKDNGSEVNVGDKSQTEYTLCTYDSATGTYVPVDENDARFTNIEAVWNKDAKKYEVIISSEDVTKEIKDTSGKLDVDTAYYLVKGDIHPEYQDNDTVFKAVIGTDGTVEYQQCKETGATEEGTPTTTVFTDVLVKAPANNKVVINVEFSDPFEDEPTDTDGGKVKYQVYSDPACTTKVEGVVVSASKDTAGNWKAEFGTDLTKKMAKNTEYYVAVDNGSSYKDVSKDVYKVKFEDDGTTMYNDPASTAGYTTIEPTDKLFKNEGLALDVVFEETQPNGTDSKVVYKVYDETGAEVSNIPAVEATDSDDDDVYEVVVGSADTTEYMERGEKYYIGMSGNESGYTDKSEDKYWVIFDNNGNATYSTDPNASSDQWEEGPLKDVLYKSATSGGGGGSTQEPDNKEIVINVVFSGPVAGEPTDADGGNVKYQVYTDEACQNAVPGVSVTISKDAEGNWKAEFGTDLTKDLDKNREYYVAVDNGSTFKDVSEDVYKVKFDANGITSYDDPSTAEGYTATPPTDKLIKNEGIALDVVFEGTQPAGTNSNVTYDIYKDNGTGTPTKVTTTPVEAKDTDGDTDFEMVVDSDFTTENMDRNTPYYIEITNNGNDSHEDKSQDKYWVKFDDNGNAKYSTDKNAPDSEWVDGPLEDLLIPATGQTQPTTTNGKVELNVEFNGPDGTKPADNSGVKYDIYENCDANGNVSNPVAGRTTEAVKTDDGWKVEFNEDITKDLEKDKDYYVKVSGNESGYKDVSTDVYKVKFDPVTGEAQYYDPASDKYVDTPPTDKLIKNEGLALDVVFEGTQPEGTDSKVTYDVYKEDGTKVTTTPVEATDSNNDDTYEVAVDSKFTTDNMDRNTPYYIGITGNESGYTDKSKDQYWVKFDDNGNAKYSTDKDAPADQWVDGPLKDVLAKDATPAVPNDKIELNVEFNGPTGTTPNDNSGVKYEIYEDCDGNGNVSKPVSDSTTEAVKNGNGWKVEFSEDITKDLEKDKDYYVKVSTNGSDYKDVSEDVYKVKFDPTTGETQYYDPANGNYTTTVPTDKLIKNEGLELDVVFKGDQPTGTDSDVTYDVYDKDGNKVTKEPIKATDTDGDKNYEVVVDPSFTTDKLDRDETYYIGISDNKSNYTDESKDKYWVKFDDNGNVSYSKDGNTWQDTPMQDVLVKETTTGGSNNSGSSNSGSSNSGSSNTGSTGSNNTGSVTSAGSTVVTSPKTGEDNTVFLFMGLAVVSAIAAGACAYRRRRV